MPVVKMPDGTLVNMPDNPSPEQLEKLRAMQRPVQVQEQTQELPPVVVEGNVGEGKSNPFEYGRAVLTGAVRGAAGLPAFAADATSYLTGKLLDQYANSEWNKNTPIGMAAGLAQAGRKKFTDAIGMKTVGEGIEKVLPTETSPGPRFVQNISEGLGGAFTPGSAMTLGQKLLMGAMSGTGAGVGETFYGPLGGMAGGFLGGAGAGIALARTDNANRLLRQGMSEMDTTKDFAMAKRLERDLKEAGVTSHLKSQLLGPRSTVSQIVEQASEDPRVLPQLTTHLEKSGEQAQSALDKWRYSELPLGLESSRKRLGNVSKSAQAATKELGREANKAFEGKLVPGAPDDVLGEGEIIGLLDKLGQIADDPRYVGKLHKDNAEVERVMKTVSDLHNTYGVRQGDLEGLARSLQAKAGKEGLDGQTARMVKEAIQDYTPGYTKAREAKTDFMKAVVEPAKEGLVGDAARTKSPLSLTAKFFPVNSTQVTEIRDFGRQVGAEALGSVLDEHIMKVANASFRKPLTGPAQIREFTAKLMGTQAQRKNVYAALDTLSEANGTDPRAARVGFAKLLRGLETFYDANSGTQLNRIALEQEAGKNIPGMAVALQSRFARFLQLGATAKTYKKIADIVTSPDGLKQLEEIANTEDPKILQTFIRMNLIEAQDQNAPLYSSENSGEQ